MRCVVGVVLWFVLCYGGNQLLSAVASASAKHEGASQRAAEAAGVKAVEKYHAFVYVAAGLISIAVCSVPSLLEKHSGGFNEEEEWRRLEEAQRRQHAGRP